MFPSNCSNGPKLKIYVEKWAKEHFVISSLCLNSSTLGPGPIGLAPAAGWDLSLSFKILKDTGVPAVMVWAPLMGPLGPPTTCWRKFGRAIFQISCKNFLHKSVFFCQFSNLCSVLENNSLFFVCFHLSKNWVFQALTLVITSILRFTYFFTNMLTIHLLFWCTLFLFCQNKYTWSWKTVKVSRN